MTYENFNSDDLEETSDDPSGTHIYFYEQGHERLPENDEAAEIIARAFKAFNRDGPVRAAVNNHPEYENASHFLAEYVLAFQEVIETESTVPLLELIEPSAESLAEYLDSNEDVAEDLMERADTTEATADD
jgi:hypothetical protein